MTHTHTAAMVYFKETGNSLTWNRKWKLEPSVWFHAVSSFLFILFVTTVIFYFFIKMWKRRWCFWNDLIPDQRSTLVKIIKAADSQEEFTHRGLHINMKVELQFHEDENKWDLKTNVYHNKIFNVNVWLIKTSYRALTVWIKTSKDKVLRNIADYYSLII